MSSVSCHFCSQSNPEASKFCNQCGSPLDLKPCPRCEAMNHVAVNQCHQCGAVISAAESAPVPDASQKSTTVETVDSALAGDSAIIRDSIPIALSTRFDAADEPATHPPLGANRPEMSEPPAKEPTAASRAIPIVPGTAVRSTTWRERPRRRAPYAALAIAGVCVIAGAAYYGYESGLLPAYSDLTGALVTKEPASSDTPGALPATAPASADHASSTAPEAPRDETIAPAVTPPAAPPPGPAMAPAPKSQSAVAPAAAAASSEPRATAQPPAAAASDATEEPSSAARALGSATRSGRASSSPRSSRRPTNAQSQAADGRSQSADSRSQADKDALATQRLIERDLEGFVPSERAPDRRSRSP